MTQRDRAQTFLVALAALVLVAPGCGSRGGRAPAPCPKCPGGGDGGLASAPPRSASGGAQGAVDGGAPGGRRPQHFSLAAAAKGYRSHAECVTEIAAGLPPELTGEADPVNLAERVCQTRRALAEKSVSLCEEIQDAHWPLACRRLLAGLHGWPEACPPLAPRTRGREPACLALATRDPSLCQGVRRLEARQRCQALLGPAGGCRALRTSGQVEACERDRRRWRTVLRPAKPALDSKFAPELTLAVTAGGKTVTVPQPGLRRGVVVPQAAAQGATVRFGRLGPVGSRAARARIRIVLEVDRQDGPLKASLGLGPATPALGAGGAGKGQVAPRGTRRPAPKATRRAAPKAPGRAVPKTPARVAPKGTTGGAGRARLCILWKGAPVPLSAISGQVELGPVPAQRGAAVTGSFTASFTVGGETVRLGGKLRTFVRDVVPGAWLAGSCAEALAERARGPAPSATTPPGPGPGPEEGPPCYFVAHWDGLTQVGYRAYGLRPGGACARLGLRENDVVTRVGASPLRRWADVTALYGLLGRAGPVTVKVRRGSQMLTLRRR